MLSLQVYAPRASVTAVLPVLAAQSGVEHVTRIGQAAPDGPVPITADVAPNVVGTILPPLAGGRDTVPLGRDTWRHERRQHCAGGRSGHRLGGRRSPLQEVSARQAPRRRQLAGRRRTTSRALTTCRSSTGTRSSPVTGGPTPSSSHTTTAHGKSQHPGSVAPCVAGRLDGNDHDPENSLTVATPQRMLSRRDARLSVPDADRMPSGVLSVSSQLLYELDTRQPPL